MAGFEFMFKKNGHRTALKVILFYCSVLNEYMKRGIVTMFREINLEIKLVAVIKLAVLFCF